MGLGVLGGVALIRLLDLFTPHEHLIRGYEGPPELANKVKRSWLVALAITIHNIPEGLAVGGLHGLPRGAGLRHGAGHSNTRRA